MTEASRHSCPTVMRLGVGRPFRQKVRSYFTSVRGFANTPLEAAISTREWNARLGGPGNGLGDTQRVPMPAMFEALGRTPR